MAKKKNRQQSPLTSSNVGQNVASGSKSKKSLKRERAEADDAEERRLTALLFGGEYVEAPPFQEAATRTTEYKQDHEHDLFQIDRSGKRAITEEPSAADSVKSNGESDSDDDDDEEGDYKTDKPVWVDEDDKDVAVNLLGTNRLKKLRTSRDEVAATALDGIELERRLRKRFQDTAMATARTDWAQITTEKQIGNDDDEEDDMLKSSSIPLLASSSHRLPPQVLNVSRCPDANQKDPNQAVVQAVHFHPGSDPDRPLMLTAGLDKTLRFFQVDSEDSHKIHGIHFPKLPIYSASFLGDSGKVVVSGRRPYFYLYDAVAGKLDLVPRIIGREEKSLEKFSTSPDGRTIAFIGNDGYIILVDAHSKHWIADLKMNGSVRAVTFTPDGEYIIGSGSDGDVYRWNLQSRRCVERFSNDDGTITSSLSASMKHLAVGAESGVVNLYSDHGPPSRSSSSRVPIKSIMNLHTSADFTKFNHDGQILAMSSRREKQTMKLLHVPTATIFSNWPTSKTPLGYVWSMDFSPQSKFFAVGNEKGKCLLYKLMHYQEE